MQHDSNAFRGGFTGVGALMDPGFLRDVTHPEDQANIQAHPTARAWAAAVVERAATRLATWFHPRG